MENNNGSSNDREESSPFLSKQVEEDEKKRINDKKSKEATTLTAASPEDITGAAFGWTADGLPLVHESAVGEPMGSSQWNSSLFGCLGRNDEFFSSDIEVCLLGSVAPCVLFGSNVERLISAPSPSPSPSPGIFATPCLSYAFLCLMGNYFLGWNFPAQCFAFATRTAIRRKFNLEGTCVALDRSCGCCGSCVEDEERRERCDFVGDYATHVLCHPCALCQEGRELRRRLPHPGFKAQPVLDMIPPGVQTMGRVA